MRSDLVFGAMTYVSNRFLLARIAASATRKFHRPNTRIQDTADEVFERFSRANPIAGVPYTGTLQPFPSIAQDGTYPFYEDLDQSVA
jgi:hypothetical protein